MRICLYCLIGIFLLPVFCSAGVEPANGVKLSLAQAVKLALANNIGLQLQKDDVSSAEGVKEAAEGEFDIIAKGEGGAESQEKKPLIPGGSEEDKTAQWSVGVQKKYTTGTEVSLNWTNSRFASTPATTLVDPVYNSGLTLALRQPLLQGFGTDRQTATMRASEKNLAAATFLVSAEAANLAAKVKGAYWNLVYAWQDKSVKELSLKLARKLLDETEEKIRAGKLAPVDIYQPQSEIARREEGLISADRAIGLYEDELKLLLNSRDWNIPFIPADLPPTTQVTPDLKVIEDNALSKRPDLKAAELAIQAAKIQEEVALDNTRPALALVGLVGQGGTNDTYGDSLSDAVDTPETQWQAGLAFSMPLQNSGAKGLYRQAGAAHNKAKNSAQLLRLQVQQSVRTTVRDVQLAQKAMEATKKTTLATHKRLEAEQAKFDVGRATTFDVLTAQDAYSQTLSQEKASEVGYALALAELDRIQGQVGLGVVKE
ncbi:MAG: TolC family protein [Proteobacteria bacterium]|nr:TolC family protein [Pseudomonadota bacterium]